IFELKQEYSIEKVGIWLTLGGYWHGIDPQSEFFMDYESSFLSIPYRVPWSTEEISDRTFSICLDKDLGIYSDWFEYLKGEGVDFLKIDHQNLLQEFCKHAPFSEFEIGTWFKAVLELAERIFGQGHVLHCMGMVPMAYLNTNGHGVYRISEDYFPHNFSYNPLAGNGAVHAVNNFSTAMWMHHLVHVDGDMFQSHHPHAYYHAAVRFLMGGVIYSTDFPGEFQMNLFRKLVNREGKLRRWRKPACPIPKCIFQLYEPEPYIVSSLEEGLCYLGIFNVSDTDEVIGSWSCDDIPGLIGSKFRAIDWMTEESFDFLWDTVHDIRLERMGFKLYVLEGL
ncbi:MAG: hypothetical protein K2Q22_06875, partial [Cytophagales bacterium]|nr:hypothetical protein [Cytophagales bacterium]